MTRSDADRLRYLAEYCEGVEPVEIKLGSTWTQPPEPVWEVWDQDRTLLLGSGPTLAAALDSFCDYFDREYPPFGGRAKAPGAAE